MRITKAVLNLEDLFNQFEIEFFESNQTTIHYIVGDNGSGKTHLIQHLHKAIIGGGGSDNWVGEVDLFARVGDPSLIQRVKSNSKWDSKKSTSRVALKELDDKPFITGTAIPAEISEQEKKYRLSVLSNVEVSFKKEAITAITADQPDTENPTGTSNNLNVVIPQILVNIQQQDDHLIANWSRSNAGGTRPTEKLPRFKLAYNKIFGGEKTFVGVSTQNGEHKVIFADRTGKEINVSDLSSGEKQIVFRLGFILQNLDTLEHGVVLIDEPEISLHPKWQLMFKKVLLEVFDGKNVQIIIATHSPYIFGDINPDIEECIKINRIANTAVKITFPQINQSAINDSPSMNLVNYKAYGIASTGLHIELYNAVQIACGSSKVVDAENWLVDQGLIKSNHSVKGGTHFKEDNGSQGFRALETIPTWIRNTLNHPMEDRQQFNDDDLIESIELMLLLL